MFNKDEKTGRNKFNIKRFLSRIILFYAPEKNNYLIANYIP